MSERIQRKRTKGWKMPDGAVSATRPGKFGNPFRVGGYFKIGNGGSGFTYLECLLPEYLTADFVEVETVEQAVEMFREYRRRYPIKPIDLSELRGKNLACWCRLDQPCHADVLLEIANAPTVSEPESGEQSK
jgi:hypothetical protein